MPQDRYLGLPEAFAHRFDQLVEVGDELLDGHGGFGDLAVERFAGTVLVPVDNCEAPFERRIEMTEKTHLRHARPTVQKDQGWIREALAANHHPLSEAAQTE